MSIDYQLGWNEAMASNVYIDTQSLLRHLSSVVKAIYSAEDTINEICKFFGATSGCIWTVNRTMGREVFFLSAKHNRPDLEALIKRKSENRFREYQITYDISEKSTVSSKMFGDGAAIVGVLGEKPFSNEWLNMEHTRGLQGLGVKAIALLPIFNATKLPIASLSLYFPNPLSSAEIDFLNEFAQFFSLLWGSSLLKVEESTLKIGLLTHELVGDMAVLTSANQKLQDYLKENLLSTSLSKTDVFCEDINSKISSIGASLQSIGIFDKAHQNESSNTFVSLREEINTTIQPLLFNIPTQKLSLEDIYYLRPDIQIRMHSGDLGHIIRNIFENAIKYSEPSATITVRITEHDGKLRLTVSNISQTLEERQWASIWAARVRGSKEAIQDIPGSGLGLFVVAELCKIYNLGYRFWQEPFCPKDSEQVWSRVQIQFPKDRVR